MKIQFINQQVRFLQEAWLTSDPQLWVNILICSNVIKKSDILLMLVLPGEYKKIDCFRISNNKHMGIFLWR